MKKESLKKIMSCEIISKELDLVEEKLKSSVSSKDKFISGIAKYLFATKGKRMRPSLLLLSYLAASAQKAKHKYPLDDVISIAVVIEMLHTASLIHDDVIDSSGLRRGAETVNSKWGNKISTLMGDYLYSIAASIMSDIGNNEILKIVTGATGRMCEGEIKQVYDAFNPDISERKYINIITGKTASLFGVSCEAGAILAGGNQNNQNLLRDFGVNLGISFQIIDDILDIVSENGDTGKPVGSDLKEGKFTLPYIYTFRLADNRDKKIIIDTIIHNNGFKKAKDILNEYKAIEYARKKALSYKEAAKNMLKNIPDSSAKEELIKIADFVVMRTN